MNETINEKRKSIVNKLIQQLSNQHMDLYYTDSNTIANLVYEQIQNKENLNKDELDLMKGLSQKDIHILISYKTSCC